MRNKLKKLLLGLTSSMIFFGSNVYAAVGDISSSGISVGAIIGVVLVVLVLLLGYKMDKAAEESEKDKEKKDGKSIKNLEDELDAESNESEYAPIKEDMPYEEEAGEGYEEEETTVSAPAPAPAPEPESSFSGPAAASSTESYTVDSSKGTASFRADPIPDFTTTSSSSKVSDETMVFSSKEDEVPAPSQEVSNEPEVNYTGFDASSSTVEDEISKLDDYSQDDEDIYTSQENVSIDESAIVEDDGPDPYDLNDGINKKVVEEAPVNLDTSNGEIASFSFDSDSFSSMDDEEEETEDLEVSAPTSVVEPEEDDSYELGDLNAQIDSLDEEDAAVEEKVSKEVEEYKQKVNIEKEEEFTGFTTKEDVKPVSKEDDEVPSFTTKEDVKSASEEEFTGFTTKEDVKQVEPEEETSFDINGLDEDQFTASNSEDDMDNIDFVEPPVKEEDPYERDPETFKGFSSKEDVGFSGGLEKKEDSEVKVQDPTMSEEFTFARETEKSEKEKMSDEELVASTDLDDGFLNQMEANLKRNQEKRNGDKK